MWMWASPGRAQRPWPQTKELSVGGGECRGSSRLPPCRHVRVGPQPGSLRGPLVGPPCFRPSVFTEQTRGLGDPSPCSPCLTLGSRESCLSWPDPPHRTDSCDTENRLGDQRPHGTSVQICSAWLWGVVRVMLSQALDKEAQHSTEPRRPQPQAGPTPPLAASVDGRRLLQLPHPRLGAALTGAVCLVARSAWWRE